MDRILGAESAGILSTLRSTSLRWMLVLVVATLPAQLAFSHVLAVRIVGLAMLLACAASAVLWRLGVMRPVVAGSVLVVSGATLLLTRLIALLTELPADPQQARLTAGALAFQTFVLPPLGAAMLWRPDVLLRVGGGWLTVILVALVAVPGAPQWTAGPQAGGEVARLLVLAALTLLAVNVLAAATQRMREAEASAVRASLTDPLTGLPNRRALQEELRLLVADAGDPVHGRGLLLIDIDHFKAVNDQHGHEAGDRVLCEVAAALEASVRRGDTVGRWGGEEFLVLTEGVDALGLASLARRMRDDVERLRPEPCGSVTISVGATIVVRSESPEVAVARADAALYAAKDAGRNRCVVTGHNGAGEQPPSNAA